MAGHDRLTPEGIAFFKQLDELKELQVRVGFQRGQAAESSGEGESGDATTDLCDIAAYNELGTKHIPSRPFLRQTADKAGENIAKFGEQAIRQVTQGGTADTALMQIGNYVKGQVQNEIASGDFVPNAEATIRRKGSETPLIDTGRMRGSVSFYICKKGEFD